MGDDPDPHPHVGQPPEGLGTALDGREVAQHALVRHGEAVESGVLLVVEAPGLEPPGRRQRQRLRIDPLVRGNHLAEAAVVVRTHAIEVDPEDETRTHGDHGSGLDLIDGAIGRT